VLLPEPLVPELLLPAPVVDDFAEAPLSFAELLLFALLL
jgi:hypothetical protein